MDDTDRAMLLDVYRGHVTAADAIAKRLDITPRDVKLRRAVVQTFESLLRGADEGMDATQLLSAIRGFRDEYAGALKR